MTLSPYFLDRTEVTQRAYARCVAAGACRPARGYAGREGPRLPVVGVTWDDAASYCRFAGKRLPTEAEWEKGARGSDGRPFPWGAVADCGRANYGSYGGEGPCGPLAPGRPVAVGSYPSGRSPSGALDLAGNVWEWVADWYGAGSYRDGPAADPRGPPSGVARVVRGGACCSMFLEPRAANRLRFPPDYRDDDLGFRCARSAHPRR